MQFGFLGKDFQVIEMHMFFANGHQGSQVIEFKTTFLHTLKRDNVHAHCILLADKIQHGDLQFMHIKIHEIDL